MKAQDLKNSILQLAIQGKLVPQDVNDEPAEVLYAKIQAEKQKLIKEGKIKKDKPLPPITDDEIPFAIPSTWKWVRLGDIAVINGGFAFKSTQYKDSGIRVIRISDFDENGFKNNKIVRYNYTDDLEQYLIEKNNIIMAMTGGTVGKSYFVSDLSEKMVSNQRVATIKINSKANSEYINIVILAPVIQKLIQISKNSTNDNISMDLINNFPVPLPPLAEQKRIVAKIEELMQYCEELTHPEKRKEVEPITIEWLIDKGFDSCKQNGYTDVNAILDELNIAVMQDRNLKKGRIEYDNNKKKFQIWVNDLNDNWTKAHELVHYVNDNNEIKLYGAVGRKDETSLSKTKERNVDALTAEILMPEDIFVSAVEQDNIKKCAFVDNAVIRKLGKQFRVSDDAVKIRLQNLGYHTK